MKKSLFFGAMALGLLLTGCSSDDLLKGDAQNAVSDKDQTVYVSLKIHGDMPESRASETNGAPNDDATDFAAGSTQESKVNNAYFVFYDEDGNVVGDIVSVDLPDPDATPVGATVEQSYKDVVSVSVRKGEKMPYQVICYINPLSPGSLNVNLNTIQTVTRSAAFTGTGTNQYFAMSNSVYYPNGEAPGSTPQIAVTIEDGQLYETEAEATDALNAGNCVDIYVERYATKLAFTQPAEADRKPYQTATRVYNADGSYESVPVTLTFTPQYWAVNAEANRTYVIKSFREESEDGILLGNDYTYGALNTIINSNGTGTLSTTNSWDWNNPDYHRSYWGMSPAYYTAEYPEVSSDLMGEDALQVNQTYISYNELATKGFEASNTNAQYFKETTVGKKALGANNPAAAVASVIYVGQYGVSVNGTAITDNPGFYTFLNGPVTIDGTEVDRPYVYFENDAAGNSKVSGGESMLKRFLAQATILYRAVTDEDDKILSYERLRISNAADLQKLVTALKVDEISDDVKKAYDGDEDTKLKLQNNARTLQFNNATSATGIYILTGNGYNEIVADDETAGNGQITLTQANLALMRQVGLAYYYTTGHAYFNIPVKHLGWYRLGNDQKGKAIDWNKVRVGDLGMVRNHSYTIQVESIEGLASGIGGDDVPIVPPATEDNYFVAYSVRILKWAIVPTQNVKL